MLTREEILNTAIHDCYKEMYAKAQPSADWDQIIKEFKEGKRDKNECVYEQHYLSQQEYTYIINKYLEAYNITSQWRDDVEVVERYLNKGGYKDKYIPEHKDPDGFVHPGYRSYEEVPPLKEQILNIMKEFDCSEVAKEVGENIYNKVMELISECKNYYKFDREESSFRCTIALGHSPTSNAETVKKYWKEKTGEDIKIEERNPKLFWYKDMGYTDEDMEYEFDDPNWKETLDKEWKDELKKKEEESLKRREELEKKLKEEENNEESIF